MAVCAGFIVVGGCAHAPPTHDPALVQRGQRLFLRCASCLATLAGSITAAAPNGRIVLIGALGGTGGGAGGGAGGALPSFSSIIGKNLVLRGITAGSRAMLQDLVTAAANNGLEPVIGAQYGFDGAAQAYAALAAGTYVGKVLIRMPQAG